MLILSASAPINSIYKNSMSPDEAEKINIFNRFCLLILEISKCVTEPKIG